MPSIPALSLSKMAKVFHSDRERGSVNIRIEALEALEGVFDRHLDSAFCPELVVFPEP